ncbi:MAG: YigZ family protein [Bacteroidaceae bacterium]|nr:YigZ family protein [Bacteroidaceae bacterium]MBQ5839190.1 YigZ family protein [Bacteroidaceae bacterium]MBQ5911872.1 YigZ family protein [Bacteroidaceae bacterium]
MRDSYKVLIKPSEGTYSELRSKFLAFAIPVRTAEEALEQVAKYQKEYFDARHVCWAYRLGPEGEEYRSNDNGEPSGTAGKPILGQMVSADVSDLIILVIRYFGGVKLGTSGLIVAYKTAASLAIEAGEFAERLVEKEMKLTFGYEHMNMVMRMVKDLQSRIISQDYKDNGDIVMTIAIRLSLVNRVKTSFVVNGQSLVKVEEA